MTKNRFARMERYHERQKLAGLKQIKVYVPRVKEKEFRDLAKQAREEWKDLLGD